VEDENINNNADYNDEFSKNKYSIFVKGSPEVIK
jgi:hypothetical protein